MTLGFLFWFLLLLYLILGIVWHRDDVSVGKYGPAGGSLFVFVLLIILGLKVFGFPIVA